MAFLADACEESYLGTRRRVTDAPLPFHSSRTLLLYMFFWSFSGSSPSSFFISLSLLFSSCFFKVMYSFLLPLPHAFDFSIRSCFFFSRSLAVFLNFASSDLITLYFCSFCIFLCFFFRASRSLFVFPPPNASFIYRLAHFIASNVFSLYSFSFFLVFFSLRVLIFSLSLLFLIPLFLLFLLDSHPYFCSLIHFHASNLLSLTSTFSFSSSYFFIRLWILSLTISLSSCPRSRRPVFLTCSHLYFPYNLLSLLSTSLPPPLPHLAHYFMLIGILIL